MTKDKYPPLPEPDATGFGDEYESFDRHGKSMGNAFENIQYFGIGKMRAYADEATAMQAERQTQEAGAYESAVKGRQEFRLALIEARGQLGGLRDRHAQELAAYELTVSNLRAQLAAHVPEADFGNIAAEFKIDWAKAIEDAAIDYADAYVEMQCDADNDHQREHREALRDLRKTIRRGLECASAPQPETTDEMGIPSSCGKPLCSRVEHHPLCKMHQPQPAAQQTAEIERLRADADQKRGLLLWALWHHQGGSSPVGQPIRRHFGIGPSDRMTVEQIRAGASAATKEHQ